MNKKAYIILGIAIFLIVGIAVVGMYKFNYLQDDLYIEDESGNMVRLNDYQKTFIDRVKNGTYVIDDITITLKDGISEIQFEPGSASILITEYIGPFMIADLNNDGKEDIIAVLTQNSGGTGNYLLAVAQLSTPNGYIGTNAVFIGDRVPIKEVYQNENGELIVSYLDRTFDQSFDTKPSLQVLLKVKVYQNKLISVGRASDTKSMGEEYDNMRNENNGK